MPLRVNGILETDKVVFSPSNLILLRLWFFLKPWFCYATFQFLLFLYFNVLMYTPIDFL